MEDDNDDIILNKIILEGDMEKFKIVMANGIGINKGKKTQYLSDTYSGGKKKNRKEMLEILLEKVEKVKMILQETEPPAKIQRRN